jgi:hypothetical protein
MKELNILPTQALVIKSHAPVQPLLWGKDSDTEILSEEPRLKSHYTWQGQGKEEIPDVIQDHKAEQAGVRGGVGRWWSRKHKHRSDYEWPNPAPLGVPAGNLLFSR